MGEPVLSPGTIIRPEIDQESARKLIESLYGFKVQTIKEVKSYDDRNFYIEVGNDDEKSSNKKFVFKIANTIDSGVNGLFEAISSISMYLLDCGFNVPYPIEDLNGQYVSRIHLKPDSSAKFAVRLLYFVDGKTLYDVPYTPELLYQTGALVGKLSDVFEKYDDEVVCKILEKQNSKIWSLYQVPKLRDFTYAVKNPDDKKIVEKVIESFEDQVSTRLKHLKTGPIHGDVNEQNIIVNEISNGDVHVNGVIDFGDMHKGALIFDLILICAYCMIDCTTIDQLLAPLHIIKGYKSVRSITEDEKFIIPICVRSRLCQSLVMGAYTHLQDPSNEYILTTQKSGWALLRRLFLIEDKELLKLWNI